MASKEFFNSILEHYEKQLPFVAYCKPNAFDVIALLQKDDTLYKIDDFSESGFVFAPFDIRKDAILIPFSTSKTLKLDSEFLTHDEFDQVSSKHHINKQDHLDLITKGINSTKAGKIQKVVLSRVESIATQDFNFIQTFIRLLNTNNLAFVYCWYHPKVGLWLGATPESLLSINNNQLNTMALAGTQEYEGVLDVKWNSKEVEEQKYVLDYMVKNLQSFAQGIEILDLKTVKAGSVLHLKSDIIGTLNTKNYNLKKMVYALHPTPAVCGIPKIEAMQFILDNEHHNREFYSGFLGELNYESLNSENRNSDLYVNLRCMQYKDKAALIYVGGGITASSIPELEWEETANKAKTMKSVIAF